MSSILFYDPLCQAPYSTRTRHEAAQGGTEATVSRIADALEAFATQHNRTEAEGRYLPASRVGHIEHLVVVRDPRRLEQLHARFPEARLYLWMHDLVYPGNKRGRRLAAHADALRELAVTIVCVSDSQRRGVEALLASVPGRERIRITTIYNPIDDALVPNGAPVDPTKLVFFSSPNKGLAYALDAFGILRRSMPELRLHIGNPGYRQLHRMNLDAVHWLGALPSARILEEVRTALCVFYPNFVLPETFGLVLAEANAVGTPVLTHDCGSAAEVLADPRQLLAVTPGQRLYERAARAVPAQCRKVTAQWAARLGVFEPYVERIRAWKNGERPRTGPDARFRLSAIAARWRALFADQLVDG